MKNIAIILIIATTLISCKQKEDHSKENIELIEAYIKSVENLNSDAMDTILADDYIGYGPTYNSSIGKEDAINNWKETSKNLYKSIKYSKNRNIAVSIPDGENKGDWVTNWAELTITYKKDNKEVTLWANTLYQVENGKISYTIYNEADALNQLGYIFIKK